MLPLLSLPEPLRDPVGPALTQLVLFPQAGELPACWVAWYFDGRLSGICADHSNPKIKWITIIWIYSYLTRLERFFQSFPLVTGQKILTSIWDTRTMKGTFFSSSTTSSLTAQSD